MALLMTMGYEVHRRMSLKIIASAKINLGLEIGEKRANGYHNVYMVMQSVSLYDEIELEVHSGTGKIKLDFSEDVNCSIADNIVFKAIKAFFSYIQTYDYDVYAKIKKNIPICAGMAGGSADGAGVIVGLNKILKIGLTLDNMCEIGESVGADVPFCIKGGTAYASGTGTDITSINSIPNCWIVIVKPKLKISTQEAYASFDKLNINFKRDLSPLLSAIQKGNLPEVCENLYNRFEEIVNEPEIFEIKRYLKEFGADGSLMTGSGSAVYGIFQHKNNAKQCFENIKKFYKSSYLVTPVDQGIYVM